MSFFKRPEVGFDIDLRSLLFRHRYTRLNSIEHYFWFELKLKIQKSGLYP